MRDPREQMAAYGEAYVEVTDGEPFPILDPTHPDGPRKQMPLCTSTARSPGCGHPVEWHVGAHTPARSCGCCSWRQNEPEQPARTPGQRYTDPLPPPAGLDVDPEKWRRMPRAERRAMMRGRR